MPGGKRQGREVIMSTIKSLVFVSLVLFYPTNMAPIKAEYVLNRKKQLKNIRAKSGIYPGNEVNDWENIDPRLE